MTTSASSNSSRRTFLKQSGGALTGAALAQAVAGRSYAAENHTIQVALVGCGGRGTGAAGNALSTPGPTQLVAVADVFDFKLKASLGSLTAQYGDQVDVPPDRQFLGMQGYKQAIDVLNPGDVVLLTTPPAFRPIHLEYAVQRGIHVFMEKSFAVDGPGIRRVLRAGEEAGKKNLKIAGGLMSRHSLPLQDVVRQIHDGAIGEVVTCWAYREHGPVGYKARRDGMNELQHQIHNYNNFTWVNGSFMLDWLIHNLDVCCWVKDAWPVAAQGQGGRQERSQPDQLFDHYAVEYTYPDGTRMLAQGRHMANCWGFFGDVVHGTTGCGILGEGVSNPRLFKGHKPGAEALLFESVQARTSPYQVEHNRLFDAIRNNKTHNEAERCAYAAMTGILGRMAAESGKRITWEEAMNSKLELAPGLERFTLDSDAPVVPDAEGSYPVARPGYTAVV